MSLPRSSTGILLYATAAVVSILVRQVRIRMYLPPSSLPAVTTAVQVVETLLILEKPVGYFSIAHHRMYEYLYVYKVCFFQKKKKHIRKELFTSSVFYPSGSPGCPQTFSRKYLALIFVIFVTLFKACHGCGEPLAVAKLEAHFHAPLSHTHTSPHLSTWSSSCTHCCPTPHHTTSPRLAHRTGTGQQAQHCIIASASGRQRD